MEKLSVLLVDDDLNICKTLGLGLRALGCDVVAAGSVAKAAEALEARAFDLVLSDFRMEGRSGVELLREVRRIRPEALAAIMTAFASIENAVEVTKEGAFDYLAKPFTQTQLEHLLKKVRLVVRLRRENERFRAREGGRGFFAGLTSVASQRLREFVGKVAPTEATVLLVGESGTGKSELARHIHRLSSRAERAFVTVNCTSLAESLIESELFGHVKGAFTGAVQDRQGKIELAHQGTLFLDEIGDLSLGAQAKLLRFLQERVIERVGGNQTIAVDARVIAATNKNLSEAVATGKFREDLYYRLNVFECTLVPLRHRMEDVPVMIRRFLAEIAESAGLPAAPNLPPELLAKLLGCSWPGNVRELRNVIERLVLLSSGRQVSEADLPEKILAPRPATGPAPASDLVTLEEVEKRHIRRVLEIESNQERAAEILGITKVTLWRKRKEYGLP